MNTYNCIYFYLLYKFYYKNDEPRNYLKDSEQVINVYCKVFSVNPAHNLRETSSL